MGESTSNEGSATTHGNALPNRDPPDVTRIKAAAAKRVQAHRWRRRLGLRCVTVRVSDREVRQLISTGYLTLESKETPAAVAIALGLWDLRQSPMRANFGPMSGRIIPNASVPRTFGDAPPGIVSLSVGGHGRCS